MAFLTIAGTNYDVSVQEAGERAPRYVGATPATFNGGLRDSRRARKRTWVFTLGPMDVPTSEALVTAVATSIVAVTGDALAGAAINAIVEVTQISFLSNIDAVRSHMRLVQVTISET